jgi:hypothetical protein
LFIVSALSINAQYCLFFEFKAEEPEMVVSAMNEMKNNFRDEAADEQAFMSYGQSYKAQLI